MIQQNANKLDNSSFLYYKEDFNDYKIEALTNEIYNSKIQSK